MKNPISLLVLLFCISSYSQVGIGTIDPNAQLDIRSSSRTTPTNIDGILIPKINNFPTTNPTILQDGMMVYTTGNGTPARGFYYWDNSTLTWKALLGAKKINDLDDGKSDANGSSIFLGIGAGASDVSITNRNIGVGANSLNKNTGGTNNTGIGYETLLNNISGNSNTAIGSQSLKANTTNYNTGIGYRALTANTTGDLNTATGYLSLSSNVIGTNNTANGYKALQNSVGFSNTAIGSQSLALNTGSYNTSLGSLSLSLNTTGQYNTGLGFSTLKKNQTGDFNTAIGYLALSENTTGNFNTAVGNGGLSKLVSGGRNVVIGTSAGEDLTNASGNVLIGFEVAKGQTSFSNRLYIENSNSNTPLIGGNFALDRVGINRPIDDLTNTFEVGGEASKADGGEWLANSDRRLKSNIQILDGITALKKILNMKGVSYEWNDSQTGIPRPEGIQYGFIAQELMEVFPEKVTLDRQGYYQTAYGTYDAFYVQAIKELKKEIDLKDLRISELEHRLDILDSNNAETSKTIEIESRLKKLEIFLASKTLSKN